MPAFAQNAEHKYLTLAQSRPTSTVGESLCKSSAMSELRRRAGKVFSEASSEPPSRDATPDPGDEVRVVPVKELKRLTKSKKSRRKSWLIFSLGGLFGLLLAVFFAHQQQVIKLEGLLDVNLDSLFDAIPAGIVRDVKDLSVRQQARQ